jgi:hypothetical protein
VWALVEAKSGGVAEQGGGGVGLALLLVASLTWPWSLGLHTRTPAHCRQVGVKFSLNQAKKRGMPPGSHFCDYFLFLDSDQVSARASTPASIRADAWPAAQHCHAITRVCLPRP